MKQIGIFIGSALLAAGFFTGGCSWLTEEAKPREITIPAATITLERDTGYVPLIGKGFHWKVQCDPETAEPSYTLHIWAGNTLLGGSTGGLPTDIYVGWLDNKLLKFCYPEFSFPEDRIPMRVRLVFTNGKTGTANGWMPVPEGKVIYFADDPQLDLEVSEQVLVEFNVDPERLRSPSEKQAAAEAEGPLLLPARKGGNYVRANSLLVELRPSQEVTAGIFPVAEPDKAPEDENSSAAPAPKDNPSVQPAAGAAQ